MKLYRPSHPLSMTGNFNFALSQAKGDWISLIGADDGVMPNLATHLEWLLSRYPEAEAFVSPRAYFFWPGVEDVYGSRRLLFHGSPRATSIKPENELKKILFGSLDYFESLQMYTGSVVSRNVVNRITERDSQRRFFRTSQPDAYSAFALLFDEPTVVKTQFPFHWVGSSPSSNGYQHAVPTRDSPGVDDFWQLSRNSDDELMILPSTDVTVPVQMLILDAAIRAQAEHRHAAPPILSSAGLRRALSGSWSRSSKEDRLAIERLLRLREPPIRLSRLGKTSRLVARHVKRVSRRIGRQSAAFRQGVLIDLATDRAQEIGDISAANSLLVDILPRRRFQESVWSKDLNIE